MFKGILTTISLLIAGTAHGQDISIPMALIGPGSTITISDSNGAIYTHHMLGQSGVGEWVYETYEGPNASGNVLFVQYADGDGNLTRRVDGRGRIDQWVPHRCNRVVGQCTYTEVRHDGSQRIRTRHTNVIPGGFVYEVLDQTGDIVLEGNAQLDSMRWTRFGEYISGNRPAVQVQMLSAHYN